MSTKSEIGRRRSKRARPKAGNVLSVHIELCSGIPRPERTESGTDSKKPRYAIP